MSNIEKNSKFGILLTFFLTVTVISSVAQEITGMYFLRSVPQSARLNPSTRLDYNGYFGGLIVPVLGQIPPPLNIDFRSNSFAYNDVIYRPSGAFGDSLALVISDSVRFRNFANGLKPVNKLDFNTHIDLLHFGYRVDNLYWHFSLVERISAGVSFPRDIFRLLSYGNARFPDKVIDLSGFGAKALHYHEIGAGLTYEYSSELSFGAKAKLLFGLGNAQFDKSTFKWHTDPITNEIIVEADFDINYSQPAFKIKEFKYFSQEDSMVFKHETIDVDPVKYATNMRNLGFSLDFGATYTPVESVTLQASVTDIGFIRWHDNVTNLQAKGKFAFSGINLVTLANNLNNFSSIYIDSIFKTFNPKVTYRSYKTMLPMNLYFGASYQMNDLINFGALYHGVHANRELNSAITLSANLNKNGLGAVISYTATKDYFYNLGAGIALQCGGWQTFILTDNLLSLLHPEKTRVVSVRFGSNWIIGGKKKHAALMR